MCNLHHVSPKEEIERYFRASLHSSLQGDAYPSVAVGPFGNGVFIRAGQPNSSGGSTRLAMKGQWGMIAPRAASARPASRAILTNNARIESVDQRPTYRDAWAKGRRCLIAAASYQEPNWETGRNIWWTLRRADGAPWALAGIWSEWVNPESGELVPNFSMLTMNCDGHPLLARLHKPDPQLPDDAQDKRSAIPIQPDLWDLWLHGPQEEACREVLKLPPAELFEPSVTQETDALLARLRAGPKGPAEPQQGSLL